MRALHSHSHMLGSVNKLKGFGTSLQMIHRNELINSPNSKGWKSEATQVKESAKLNNIKDEGNIMVLAFPPLLSEGLFRIDNKILLYRKFAYFCSIGMSQKANF